jgi:valyl-tRNA synthetase
MAPLAEPALEVVRDGTIKFFPERHAQQYLSWLGEKRDWPISRQLWWGHRIPVWRWTISVSDENWERGGYASHAHTLKNSGGYEWSRYESKFAEEWGCVHIARFSDENTWEEMICTPASVSNDLLHELEARGFTQDPDVLDTWFSSALWPHSTLGWPDQTADLAKWYPTSVLMTGRDIITLWVARMVMMGIYNMGSRPLAPGSAGVEPGQRPGLKEENGIPFHHVAINPTILDGKGERMSKSKGNGVDPVDIIDTHGADALRFTLTQMATETQDVRMPVKKDAQGRNTSDKFDTGRNFCTKLWNAAKFVLANLDQTGVLASATHQSPSPPLIDRWIITRFNRAVGEANEALASYRFDQYCKACYDFFWRDLCDWYIEAAKPAMKDPARQAQTGQVLASVLDGILRLMHPMIPCITERIWWQLNTVRPARGLPGLIDCAPSKRLIHAAWPTVGSFDENAETVFPQIQEIIETIRRVRNDYKIDKHKPVTVTLSASADQLSQLQSNRDVIELLAICTLAKIGTDIAPPPNAARAAAEGVDIFIEGVIDPEAEKHRLAKRREELEKERAALQARLANPSYADKAPAHLVQQTRDKLAAVETELAKLRSNS